MPGVIAVIPKYQFSSATGAPLVNGTLTVYLAGTTTPTSTWQDQALTALNTNPLALDARGECVLWLDSTKNYKFVLKNSTGVVQWTQDNLTNSSAFAAAGNAAAAAALAAPTGAGLVGGTWFGGVLASVAAFGTSIGASLVGVIQAGIGAVLRSVQDELRETVKVTQFGADKTGVGDSSAAFAAAQTALSVNGGRIIVPDGAYRLASTFQVNKNIELVLGAVVITTTAAIGIEHTSGNLKISGSGDNTSVFKHSGANHAIYSHGSNPSVSGSYLDRLVISDIGLVDLLTTQTVSLFDTWSTTRTAGAGIYSSTVQTVLSNINAFGFFDGVRADHILASTWSNVRSAWSARDGINLGYFSTSVTMNGCYTFGNQRCGIRLEDNVTYCTLNSCAADSSGGYGYYFGTGPNGLSPFNIVLNACGCEDAGTVDSASSAVYLDGAKNIIFNAPFFMGLGNRKVNTTNAISFQGLASTDVVINGGTFGNATSYFGGYGIYVPTGKYGGKLNVITGLSSIYATLGRSYDADNAIQYLQGQDGFANLFEATEVITGGAVPTYGNNFYYVIPANTVTRFKVDVIAKQTAGAGGTIGQGASYSFNVAFRDIAGVVTQVGLTSYNYTVENDASWNVDAVFNSGGVRLQFTAAANETVSWRYSVTRMQSI